MVENFMIEDFDSVMIWINYMTNFHIEILFYVHILKIKHNKRCILIQ